MPDVSRELAVLDQACRMLADAKSLDEIKGIRDKAEAARIYARAAQLGLNLQNRAAELKIRAERQAGKVLKSLKLHGGDRKSKGHHVSLKLEELGISRHQSTRWQQVASIPEESFSQFLKYANETGKEVTTASCLLLAKESSKRRRKGSSRKTTAPAEHEVKLLAHELIRELRDHCNLLTNVLRPVYQAGPLELKTAERRVVGRLLGEMAKLIGELESDWPVR